MRASTRLTLADWAATAGPETNEIAATSTPAAKTRTAAGLNRQSIRFISVLQVSSRTSAHQMVGRHPNGQCRILERAIPCARTHSPLHFGRPPTIGTVASGPASGQFLALTVDASRARHPASLGARSSTARTWVD